MDHGSFRELAAGSVLGDLDRAELAEFEAHRSTCRECRDLLEELGGVAFDLALAAPARRPPPALRDAVLSSIAASAVPLRPSLAPAVATAASTPAGLTPSDNLTRIDDLRHEARRLRAFAFTGLAAAAVLAVVAVSFGIRSLQLSDQVVTARAEAQAAEAALATQNSDMSGAMAVALDPSHLTAGLHAEPAAPAASAIVVYRPGSDEAYLMATDLPATPSGSVYQLWVADASGVHALGTYRFDGNGTFVAPFAHDLADASATMVTLEPAGGAIGEPGPQVMFGEL
jgi:hypothetical protein